MKKLIWIILIGLLVPETISCQKFTQKDHLKYWYYRHRLVEEFVIVGEAETLNEPSGLSLPAVAACHKGKNDTLLKLAWIDNPVFELGSYIGVLAMELKLLFLNGEPYENTQQELYYAMKAYERIDHNCEYLFYPNENNGSLNGLFCRGDIPVNFLYNDELGGHEDFRERNKYQNETSSAYKSYRNDVNNGYPDSALYKTYYNSMEEWRGMLMGFALLVKSLADCPAEVVIYNGYRFIDEAILHTQRFMDYLRNDNWIGRLTNDQVYRYGGQPKWGQQIYGLAKAADFICQYNDFSVPLSISAYRHYAQGMGYNNPVTSLALYTYMISKDYLWGPIPMMNMFFNYPPPHPDEISEPFQKYFWMMIGNPNSTLMGQPLVGIFVNDFFLTGNHWVAKTNYIYAAVGNSWKDADQEFLDITLPSLITYTRPCGWGLYPMLNVYLHNKNEEEDAVETIRYNMIQTMQNAPCNGPHYLPLFNEPSIGTEGWRGGNRWTAMPEKRLNGFNTDGWTKGEKWNGLDYMLAYNLLRLECRQKGFENTYFETEYTNERDNSYSLFEDTETNCLYHHNHVEINSSADITSKSNAVILGKSVLLEGEMNVGTGHTLTIETRDKITLCDIE